MGYNVIDADGHILEPPDLWEQYIEPKFREGCPKLVTAADGLEIFRVEHDDAIDLGRGKKRISFGAVGAFGARDGSVSAKVPYTQGRTGGFDPHARIPDMDAEGIDAAFLYPSLGLFLGSMKDPEFAAAACRAYNRWLADYCKPYPERLFGAAVVPMQSSVQQIIDEMRFARRDIGFFTPAWSGPIRTTTARFMTANTIRYGRRRRNSTSPSASTAAPRAARTR